MGNTEEETSMAAAHTQFRCATDSSGGETASDALLALSLCLLHDLVGVAVFLASHPLHAIYLLILGRGLVSLAAFFWPLLASTSLLLAVLGTVSPYVGGAEWHGVRRSLGRTCGIAVAALCADLRPDGGAGAGMVGQICSFVLGPTDAACVLRVEEIMGEPTACCFLLEEQRSLSLLGGDECKEPAFALPLVGGTIGERSFSDYEICCDLKDEIDEKVVISEDLKVSDSSDEQCRRPSTTILFVQEMEAEEQEEQGQHLMLSAIDEFADGVEEKRLECDPVSVEIKKSEPVQAVVESVRMEKSELVGSVETKNSKLKHALDVKICEPVQTLELKKFEPVEPMEVRKSSPDEPLEIKNSERMKTPSLIAQRIELWEAQVSGNVKRPVLDGKKEADSVEFNLEKEPIRDVKKSSVRFETDPCCIEKHNSEQQAQEVASNEESTMEQQEEEFKDVKEYTRSEAETSSEKCSQNNEDKEIAVKVAQVEEELQQGCNEPELQEQAHVIEQAEQEMEEEVYTDVTSSPATWIESPLKSTSIAGRVHSRTASENLVSEGSPSHKDKEWKRTLACKLYEERMQLRLRRDDAVVEGSDNMDMLWEAYEVGSGGGMRGGGKRRGSKGKGAAKMVEEHVDEEGQEEEEGDDDEEEGSVRQLCCLQALKFSTRKMNFGGGKPSLSKISKVLRRVTALSRMGSRRKQSD